MISEPARDSTCFEITLGSDADRAENRGEGDDNRVAPELLRRFGVEACKKIRDREGGFQRHHLQAASAAGGGRRRQNSDQGIEAKAPLDARGVRRRLWSGNGDARRSQFRSEMAPRDGFEPSTNRLTAGCSTAELPGSSLSLNKRAAPIAAGFEQRQEGQEINCSIAIRSSSACSGSKSRVSGVPRSMVTSTRATSRTSR